MSIISLPDDMIFNVLARLPVKTLHKLKGVSKSWASLIDSPEFIKLHLNLSLMNPNSQKFIFDTLGKIRSTFMFLPGNFNSLNFVSPEELYCPDPVFVQGKKLVGSSRGLVCVRYVKDGVILLNPWTRNHKKLPRSPIEIREFAERRNWVHTIYGFGYDDLNDDYKVVRLVGVRCKVSSKFYHEIKIYSLKFNKWKRIQVLRNAIPNGTSGVLLNRRLHWILCGEESILAIDLRTEECQFLSIPETFESRNFLQACTLGVSDGSLCISMGNSAGFDIWLMNDYGIKGSWTKLRIDIFGFNLNRLKLMLIRYSETERQLIFSVFPEMSSICWYDMESKILNKIEISGCRNFFYAVESLVQPSSSADLIGRRSKCRKVS